MKNGFTYFLVIDIELCFGQNFYLPKQSGDQKSFHIAPNFLRNRSFCAFSNILCKCPYPSRVKDSQHPEEDQGDHDKDNQGG